jgi:hypothetical protein
MTWPVFDLLTAGSPAPAVTTFVGAFPNARIYEDTAPQRPNGVKEPRPYITWSVAGGATQNYLSERPGIDPGRIQIDVWADSAKSRRDLMDAVMAAIEMHAHMIETPITLYEADTRLFRGLMTFQFWVHR